MDPSLSWPLVVHRMLRGLHPEDHARGPSMLCRPPFLGHLSSQTGGAGGISFLATNEGCWHLWPIVVNNAHARNDA